ncbi:hypothetical protein RFI_03383, partial [Reticulomyxa filosa]
MLVLDDEGEDKNLENERETFSSSGCYAKAWVLLTNDSQKLNNLFCCLCNQIANNAVELQCNDHENVEQAYLAGEECLQTYLKQNNEKCPIGQHDHCEFSKSKITRQQVSDLLVICPRQYDMQKEQSNEGIKTGEKGECENESNWNLTSQCNFKGKIKEMKDHLDKSCQLISIHQTFSLQIVLLVVCIFKELKEMQTEIKRLKANDDEKGKQIQQLNRQVNDLQHESVKKDLQI